MGEQGPAGRDQRLPREAAVRRLMGLDGEGRLTTGHVQLAAEGLGVSERTVWRWIEAAGPGVSSIGGPGAVSR